MQRSIWEDCLSALKSDLTEIQFNTWIKPLSAVEDEHSQTLTLLAPNKFVVSWVQKNYLDQIKAFADNRGPNKTTIAISVGGDSFSVPENKLMTKEEKGVGVAVGSTLNPNYRFATFVGGKSNQLARAAAVQITENPGTSYNPFFIYGGVGLGKTHLMQSVGNAIKEKNSYSKIAYVHSERFVGEMVSALQHNSLDRFKSSYRQLDVLLIDDIQFFAGKEKSQEEFFHTFNVLLEANKQIIMTSDKYPKEINGLEERLRSRFGWGLTVSIDPPEVETCVAILKVKSSLENFELPEDVAFFIANKIRSNVRELEGALRKVIASCKFTGREPTIALARESLRDLLALQSRQITIDNIQKTVAEYYNIRVSDLHSKRRTRSITRPRQLAMAISKELTSMSLPEIGEGFGGRDHTTVIHACRKTEDLKSNDLKFAEDYNNITRLLRM
ncbi:MAG: chromosomal replication initiator protein DnaA [Candidatus Magasanikbacteria bacterium]|jgi:chromosomal replication initiator protein|nr:chromosomal replication initiator protein DnaA [Candidatus Magasanikbacteria bacterium]